MILRSPFSRYWSITEPWSHHDFSPQQQKGSKQPAAMGESLHRPLYVSLFLAFQKPVKPKARLSPADLTDLPLNLHSSPLVALSSFKRERNKEIQKVNSFGSTKAPGCRLPGLCTMLRAARTLFCILTWSVLPRSPLTWTVTQCSYIRCFSFAKAQAPVLHWNCSKLAGLRDMSCG